MSFIGNGSSKLQMGLVHYFMNINWKMVSFPIDPWRQTKKFCIMKAFMFHQNWIKFQHTKLFVINLRTEMSTDFYLINLHSSPSWDSRKPSKCFFFFVIIIELKLLIPSKCCSFLWTNFLGCFTIMSKLWDALLAPWNQKKRSSHSALHVFPSTNIN